MKKICLIFSLLLSLFFSVGTVHAASTELNEMTVNAYINEDGSAHIQEVWEMEIHKGTEVYKVMNQMGASEITNLQVTDENGLQYKNIGKWDVDASRSQKNGKCGIVKKSNNYELCFGIGDYGKRTYTFEYDVSNFIKAYGDQVQGFNHAFFSDMSLKPDMATVSVSSPYSFDQNNAAIWAFGYNGDVHFVDGKVVMTTKGNHFNGTKMQLLMRIENGTFSKAYETGQNFSDVLDDAKKGSDYDGEDSSQESGGGFIIPILVVGIGITTVVSICMIAAYSAKKNEKMKYRFSDGQPLHQDNVNMFRDIPCQKDIFEFYYFAKKAGLIDDKDRGGLVGAILLRWIQKGYIVFDKTEESHLLFFKKDGFSINLDKELPITDPLELKLLGFIRNAAGSNKKLETKEFEKWCASHYEDIDHWFDEIDTSLEVKFRKSGLIRIEATDTQYMGFKIKRERDVLDVSLREKMEQIIGLKKFLQEMSLIDEKEVIEVKMWEEYLIFASILGIADKVSEQLGELCPTFNQQSQLDTIYTMQMVHMFAYNSMRASHAASVAAAQEARSGGFGGGASFGGGGGGFSGGGGGGVR